MQLGAQPILLSVSLGLLLPVVASISPIRHALASSVQPAASSSASAAARAPPASNRVGAASAQLPWPLLLAAAAVALFGGAIYYLLPFALITGDVRLLADLLAFVLLGLLLGLLMLAGGMQPMLEWVLLKLTTPCQPASLRQQIRHNLWAHRARNKAAARIYSMAVGFVIFIDVFAQASNKKQLFTQ